MPVIRVDEDVFGTLQDVARMADVTPAKVIKVLMAFKLVDFGFHAKDVVKCKPKNKRKRKS